MQQKAIAKNALTRKLTKATDTQLSFVYFRVHRLLRDNGKRTCIRIRTVQHMGPSVAFHANTGYNLTDVSCAPPWYSTPDDCRDATGRCITRGHGLAGVLAEEGGLKWINRHAQRDHTNFFRRASNTRDFEVIHGEMDERVDVIAERTWNKGEVRMTRETNLLRNLATDCCNSPHQIRARVTSKRLKN